MFQEDVQWDCFAITDKGKRRSLNEDYYICHPDKGIFLVADGMGGENCGEVASRLTAETFEKTIAPYVLDEDATIPFEHTTDDDVFLKTISHAVDETNRIVLDYAESHQSHQGMGSTLTAIVYYDNSLCIAHIGDSRFYEFNHSVFQQVTEDHTKVQEMVRKKLITTEDVRYHPQRHIITRCVGRKKQFKPEIFYIDFNPEMHYLICSDGLYDMIQDSEIHHILNQSKTLKQAGENLVQKANQNGGKDNISIVLFQKISSSVESDETP